jgi:isoleucyl-tRNA synthetase
MARRVGHATLQEIVRKVLLTYWNTVAFHVLYARSNGWSPNGEAPPVASRPVQDRWLASQRSRLVREVTEAMESFDTQRAGSKLADFIDDLSNWYVRRSRRRFWDGDPAALWTLHETLDVVTRLMAPLMPFVTERVWQDLVVSVDPKAPESVHLAGWPSYDEELVDAQLDAGMALARRLVELGRSARAEAKVRTRQPLSRALVPSTSYSTLDDDLLAEIAAELNVEHVESFASAGDLVDHSAKANFRALGKRFGKQTPQVAAAVAGADAERLASELSESGETTVDFEGEQIGLTVEEVIVTERPREGWSVVNEHGETIALDLHLTPDLVRAGLAREVIRLVQEARKSSGFAVSDRVTLRWHAGGDTAEALRTHADLVSREVLAVQMTEVEGPNGDWFEEADLGLSFALDKV